MGPKIEAVKVAIYKIFVLSDVVISAVTMAAANILYSILPVTEK